MPLYTYIYGECQVRIWGLTSRQRIERLLAKSGKSAIINDLGLLQDNDAVVILRADYLFDDRLVDYLVATPDVILQLNENRKKATVAAHVPAGIARKVLEVIGEIAVVELLAGVQVQTLESLSISFQQSLRKSDPPFVLPVSVEKKRDLERQLFDWSYKGVTDLITKWVWPLPARWVVGQCIRFGVQPNHVTLIGLLLVIVAGVLFVYGHYGWGLLAGWLMTFLDTVDGKLARVTVTSSRFGHYFDHIIDLFHPPIWYILWGLGLRGFHPDGLGFSLSTVLWLIVIGYAVGRLTEGVFTWCLGRFGIFCWRPVDSYFRLITARRNTCLLLLTIGAFLGRPDLGLLAVAFWTSLTTIFLVARLGMAAFFRITQGPLRSWLMDIDRGMNDGSLAARIFTKHERNP